MSETLVARRPLGLSGLTIPRVALGCGNFGGVGSAPAFFGQGLTQDQAFELMDAAWEFGLTHFDTADAYGGGRSETAIGRWIASRGVRPQLTTKTYNPMRAGADHGLKPERIARQLHASLERLGVDHVELYLAHDFDPDVPLSETFGAFEQARADGADRRLRGEQLHRRPAGRLAGGGGAQRHPEQLLAARPRQHEQDVLALCAERGVSYLAFSPLAGGWLTGKYRRGEPFPAGSRMTQRPEPYREFVSGADLRRAGPAGRDRRGPRHLDGRPRARLAARRRTGGADRGRPRPAGAPGGRRRGARATR